MHYKIEFVEEKSAPKGVRDAYIIGMPDSYIHFGHHDFDIVWNNETHRQDVVRGVNKFFGGMGEGSSFDSWQDALHCSLYDLYQVTDGLHDGDTFEATYMGQTQRYRCSGVHVVKEDQ